VGTCACGWLSSSLENAIYYVAISLEYVVSVRVAVSYNASKASQKIYAELKLESKRPIIIEIIDRSFLSALITAKSSPSMQITLAQVLHVFAGLAKTDPERLPSQMDLE